LSFVQSQASGGCPWQLCDLLEPKGASPWRREWC